MKSKEFIEEALVPSDISDSPVSDQMTAIANKYEIKEEDYGLMANVLKIGRDCKPFLKSTQDDFSLLRGLGNSTDFFVQKRIRLEGREPLGMSVEMMNTVDKIFTANFGSPFRQSALCTGSYPLAESFGDVYAIFPIGKYKFLWSPEVQDLNGEIWNHEARHDIGPLEFNDMTKILEGANYRTSDINSAIESGNEIMLRANEYYGLKVTDIGYALPQEVVEILIDLGTTI